MIYLVDLEYVETRYTAQWKDCFPQQIADKTGQDITVIEGPSDIANVVTPGAFLDFAGTNIYNCLLYTSPSPRDRTRSRMPSSA